ncbi:TonB-dependent receptor [Chlorobium phaeovibrioides]|uniref:TonB-dependent receptor n=1 Tax=Chlorobium phaeovibrioides TaxID=1094 RepID=A0ABW9UNE7_CHLPH|nr:TonB-dependent receptor [Chlorobium phaeovibrioides]MWV53589.1 TonB-dependent receptor [Chlorobium phaeovibrioides]
MKSTKALAGSLARIVLSAFLMLALLVPLAAQAGTITGTVTDKTDGEGVYGASVTVNGTTIGTATDLDGNFTLQNVPETTQKVSVSIIGYSPATQAVTVGAAGATADFTLSQTTVMASEVVVGAAMYEQDRLDMPVTVSVVSSEEIKEKPAASLDQVIENVPGVVVNRAGGFGTATVQIRGSNTFNGGGIGTRVQGLYDGFPINTPVTGEIVWHNINMNAADKVEVLKGAAATLYGSGAMGGVVNVQGSMPEKFEVKAGFSGGYYDDPPVGDKSDYYDTGSTPWFWNTYVGFGDKQDKLNYSVLYSHGDDDGYKQNANYKLDDIKFKARYDIDARQYVQLSTFYSETKAAYPTTWPIDFAANNTPLPDFAYENLGDNYDDDYIRRKNALVGLNYVNMLSSDLSVDTRLYYTRNENRVEYNPEGGDETTYVPGVGPVVSRYAGQFNEDISDRFGAGTKVDYRLNDNHRMLFGVDANIVDVQSTQYTDEIPDAPVLDDDALHGIQERNLAFFVQDEFKATDRLTILASVRYDWSDISADNVTYVDYSAVASTTNSVTTEIDNPSVDALSPRIALNYRASDKTALRASWNRSFRAPTLAERFVRDAGIWDGNPNPELDKETLTAYEVGMFTMLNKRVSFDISAYLNYYDDLIESQFLPVTGSTKTTYFTYTNVNKARIWGIETALNINPIDPVNVALTYSYMNAKNTDYEEGVNTFLDENPDPEWLPMRPEHTASASVAWKATNRLTLNTSGRYVSEYKAVNAYTDPDGENYPGDFVVFNIGAKYKVNDNFSTTLLCRNINNTQYEEAEWFRAPGRSFVLGVDFTY